MLGVKRVVLFKHGVGHFERRGTVDGDVSIDLHFKAPEMNDVLKSLTVLDLDGGHVSSVNYESMRPIEKQLEDIVIQLPDENTLTGLLSQLKGAQVEVEVGNRRVEGVVTGIETVTRRDQATVETLPRLALLVEGDSLRTFDLFEIKGIKLLRDSIRKDLVYLLDSLISAKKKDLKRLTIFARGKGQRQLVASYTIETPVWKTSYRMLVVDPPAGKTCEGGKDLLVQGWALVDNTQDEDWEDVELTLVAGLPISFVHDLYSPRYKRRPVVEVQEEEAYAPPVMESPTSGAEPEAEAPMDGMMPPSPRMAMMAAPGGLLKRMEAAESSMQVQTRTVEVGDLFQYVITNPVTVKRNQSALVPILQTRVPGRRVAMYNPEVREKNPMSAILIKNASGMTLEGGPVTVLEGDAYVGEAMLDTLRANEERIVPYSVELGCRVSLDNKSHLRTVHRCTIADGCARFHRYRVEKKIYVIDNRSDRPMELYLDHRFRPTWELVETPPPKETTDHFYRFRLDVPAKKTVQFEITERGDEQETVSIQRLDRQVLSIWIDTCSIEGKIREELEAVVALSESVVELERTIAAYDADNKEIFKDQERLRENLQALKSTQEEQGLRERYVNELTRGEDRLEELRQKTREVKQRRDEAVRALAAKAKTLRFDWERPGGR